MSVKSNVCLMMVESLANICRLAMERVAKKSEIFRCSVDPRWCCEEERGLLRGDSERLEGAPEGEGAGVVPYGKERSGAGERLDCAAFSRGT